MKSDHPLGRHCFGLRLFSPDFLIRIPQHQREINPWLKPTQALSSARAQATAALRAFCKSVFRWAKSANERRYSIISP